MKTENKIKWIKTNILLTALLILMSGQFVEAQTTTFTYQGRLSDSSMQANGSYDLIFVLYDAPTGGSQIGTTITRPAVNVANGVFTVGLDFGANTFPGAARYLEIAVKRPLGTNFTKLTPRQPVTSTPYSIRSLSAANSDNAAQLGGTAASGFVQTNDSRLSDARTPTAGSANYVQNTTTQQTAANFNIDGTGAANIFNAATQFNIGGSRVLSQPSLNNVFVGSGAGANFSSGSSNTLVGRNAGVNQADGNGNTFLGRDAGGAKTGGTNNTIIGSFAGIPAGVSGELNYATAIGAGAQVISNNTIALGRSDGSDRVQVYGALSVNTLPGGGSVQLCSNPSNFFIISTCSSSLRYKTNIAPFAFGLSLVKQLRPITFDWKEGGMHDLGFGAEDVAAVNPLLVNYNKDGQVEGVKYDRLSVLFVNAFKEQQKQIEVQDRQIERQQKQIDELKTVVCALKPDAAVCQSEDK